MKTLPKAEFSLKIMRTTGVVALSVLFWGCRAQHSKGTDINEGGADVQQARFTPRPSPQVTVSPSSLNQTALITVVEAGIGGAFPDCWNKFGGNQKTLIKVGSRVEVDLLSRKSSPETTGGYFGYRITGPAALLATLPLAEVGAFRAERTLPDVHFKECWIEEKYLNAAELAAAFKKHAFSSLPLGGEATLKADVEFSYLKELPSPSDTLLPLGVDAARAAPHELKMAMCECCLQSNLLATHPQESANLKGSSTCAHF